MVPQVFTSGCYSERSSKYKHTHVPNILVTIPVVVSLYTMVPWVLTGEGATERDST